MPDTARLQPNGVPIWALVEYLDRHVPEELSELRERHHTFSGLLAPGKVLGEEEGESDGKDELDVYLSVATSALQAADRALGETSRYLKRRMRHVARWRMAAGVTAAVSTAGLLGALLVNARSAAIGTAVVNLVATLFTVVSQELETPLLGRGTGHHESFHKLVALTKRVAEIRGELGLVSTRDREGVLDLARRANAVVAELQAVELVVRPG